MMGMDLPRLYAVTDEALTPDSTLVDQARVVLQAGVRMLQVRFKTSSHDERLRLAIRLRELTRDHDALLVINDHPALASEVEADGVHLGEHDPEVETARTLLGPHVLLGVSVYDRMDRVERFGPLGVDYFGASSPYTSPLKKAKAVPAMDAFRELVQASPVPVFGIGGVTPQRVARMRDAGCHGVAAVTAIFGSPDPARAVREFRQALGEG